MNFNDCILKQQPTGSRYICNPPVMDTDEDTLILVNGYWPWRDHLKEEGWVQEGKAYEGGEFASYRQGDKNYIITEDEAFYFAFVIATETAKVLNLRDKPARVTLHQTIRDVVMNQVWNNARGVFPI